MMLSPVEPAAPHRIPLLAAPSSPRSQNIGLLTCLLAAFTLGGSASLLLEAPIVVLLDHIVCKDYYSAQPSLLATDTNSIFDAQVRCDLEPIKSKVATLLGVKLAMDAIPGLLTAVYFGARADKHGRKPVLILAFTGELFALLWLVMICYFHSTFSIWGIWFSSVFLVFGGGMRVFLSMVYTMLADAFEPMKRNKLLNTLTAIEALISIVAPLAGSWLSKRNIWFPFAVAISLDLLCYPVMLALPETWKPDRVFSSADSSTEASPLLDPADDAITRFETEVEPKRPSGSVHRAVRETINLVTANLELFSNPNLRLCFILFFIRAIALSSNTFIMQHAAGVLDWKLSRTVSLIVVKYGASFLTVALVFPVMTAVVLRSRAVLAQRLHLYMIRGSLVVMALGYLCLAEAGTVFVMMIGILMAAVGTGVDPALRALMISFADKGHNARAFTMITVSELTGTIIGGPIMSQLFSVSIRLGGWFSGLCFMLSSVLIAVMAVITLGFGNVLHRLGAV